MGIKAVVTTLGPFIQQDSGVYELTVQALITKGNTSVSITAIATSTSFDKLLPPPWRTLIRDAVAAAALNQHGLSVDGVVFPDATVSVI